MTTPESSSPLISLKQWLSRTYIWGGALSLSIIAALLLLILVGTYFLLAQNHDRLARKEHEQQMIQALQARTDWISAQLESVQGDLQLYRKQAERAFSPSQSSPPLSSASVVDQFSLSEQNVLYRNRDDGIAIYYSAQSADLNGRPQEAAQLLTLESIMIDLQQSNALVQQIYLNTPDGLNLIYPFVDVVHQFAPDMDLTAFSFYYLADASHNPQRNNVWTDAYLDPAGQGWIISHIGPVYKGDRLEGVVGIDLTIKGLINTIFSTPQQWPGYGVLIGKNGNILALPPEGEEDFGLKELTEHQYSFQQVDSNQFKPSQFNLYKRKDLTELSRLVAHQQAGLAQVTLKEPSVVAWNTVPVTGWKLLAIAPEHELYVHAAVFERQLIDMALLAVALMLMVLLVYVSWQYTRSGRLSRQFQAPLDYFQELIKQQGQVVPERTLHSNVLEIRQTAELIQNLAQQKQTLEQQIQSHQKEQERQNKYFRNLLNSIPVPVFDTDIEFRLQGCNRAFEAFLGMTESELKGHLITEFIPLSPPDEGTYQHELVLTNASGQSRYLNVIVTRQLELSKDRHTGLAMIGLMVDLSDQYLARDQIMFDRDRAMEASQLQAEYLQAMRHELEAPLGRLHQLVAQLSQGPDNAAALMQQVKEKTDTLISIAKDHWPEVADSLTIPPPAPMVQERPISRAASASAVLVVDDGPVNTMLARSVLQKVGYEVDVAFSGKEALNMMRKKHYGVVLMDIFMPGMDGIETTQRWRSYEQQHNVAPAVIIALTANVLESERQRFFDAGMDEYLAKPYHPSELRDRVAFWHQKQLSQMS